MKLGSSMLIWRNPRSRFERKAIRRRAIIEGDAAQCKPSVYSSGKARFDKRPNFPPLIAVIARIVLDTWAKTFDNDYGAHEIEELYFASSPTAGPSIRARLIEVIPPRGARECAAPSPFD